MKHSVMLMAVWLPSQSSGGVEEENEVLRECVMLTWAQPCQGPQCLRPIGVAPFPGEVWRDGKAFWSGCRC